MPGSSSARSWQSDLQSRPSLAARRGPEKKAIVTKFLKEQLQQKNISISDEQLNTLIEAAVYELKKEQV